MSDNKKELERELSKLKFMHSLFWWHYDLSVSKGESTMTKQEAKEQYEELERDIEHIEVLLGIASKKPTTPTKKGKQRGSKTVEIDYNEEDDDTLYMA